MLGGTDPDKQLYVSFVDHEMTTKVRDLNALKVGQLTKITGQVVRTHPVHPELVSGTVFDIIFFLNCFYYFGLLVLSTITILDVYSMELLT